MGIKTITTMTKDDDANESIIETPIIPKLSEKEFKELIYKKAKVFFKKNIPVHISKQVTPAGLKGWCNGLIKEVTNDFIMLDERVQGLIPIFFSEIYDIEKLIEKEEKSFYQM